MNGHLIGVFGINQDLKSAFETSIAKKNESEGIQVFLRSEGGTKYSYLDDSTFPEKIQGYSRIASICDYAYYIFPKEGKLSAPDGELAVLLDAFSLEGSIQIMDGQASSYEDLVRSTFKDVLVSRYPLEERSSKSSVIPAHRPTSRSKWPESGTLVCIDRAFSVKGVGVVVLGFVLCGKVSVHDKLRLIPGSHDKLAEVKGIQVNDEDQDSTESGIRVGLSLKGVELKDLEKTSWLDDASFSLGKKFSFELRQSKYYKQSTVDRDLHLQFTGDLLVARVVAGRGGTLRTAEFQHEVPFWEGMPVGLIDLNGKPLRVIGGGRVSV
ncbi:MAG: EF-Tu/IF-2/RF-3 family GTPase [Nitrososphaerales archaeon]